VDELTSGAVDARLPPLPSVRGDFLAKLGRMEEAREEFSRAATLTQNMRERTFLLERARACAEGAS
jgi:predicted RNA polymerase sigma factor